MTNSEERIRVAKALRDANDTELYVMYLDEIMAGALGICQDDDYQNVKKKILTRLADLIDPTCHVIDMGWPNDYEVVLKCDVCGGVWTQDPLSEPYRFCPCCGARVVRDGD